MLNKDVIDTKDKQNYFWKESRNENMKLEKLKYKAMLDIKASKQSLEST